jgi:pilus assembly protein CpaE
VSGAIRPLRCLIVGADPLTASLLEAALESGRGLVGVGRVDPVHALAGMRPACDVLLIAEASDERGLRLVGDLAIAAPGVPTLLVTSRPDTGMLREAMAVGARGVIEQPFDSDRLAETVHAVAAPGAAAGHHHAGGRFVAVCASKGGTGATTVAVSLVVRAGGLLIDAAGGFADLAEQLGCTPERTLADIARLGQAVGGDAIDAVAVAHPEGYQLVAGTGSPEAAALVPAGVGPALARVCRTARPLTVVDLGVPVSTLALEVAVCADTVLVVVTPDRYAVRAAASLAARLAGLGIAERALAVVVNRLSPDASLSSKTVERAIGLPVLATLREDTRLGRAFADDGTTRARRRGAGEALDRLASQVMAA